MESRQARGGPPGAACGDPGTGSRLPAAARGPARALIDSPDRSQPESEPRPRRLGPGGTEGRLCLLNKYTAIDGERQIQRESAFQTPVIPRESRFGEEKPKDQRLTKAKVAVNSTDTDAGCD